MRRFRSLRVLIPALVSLFLLVAIVISVVGGFVERKAALIAAVQADSLREVLRLVSLTEHSALSDRKLLAESVARLVTDARVMAVAVIDAHGNVVVSSNRTWNNQPAEQLPGFSRPLFERSLQGHVAVMETDSSGHRQVTMMSYTAPAKPTELRSQTRGAVFLAYDLSAAFADARAALWAERFPEIIGLLLAAGLLGGFVQRLVTRPMQRMALAAEAIAAGDFNHRLPVSGPEEIRSLAQAFNQMSGQLAASMAQQTRQAGVLQTLLDEREQVEQERDRLISIQEATTDVVSLADPQGKILYLNRAGRRLSGVGDRAVSDIRIAEFHPDWASELIFKQGIPAAIRDGAWSGETALLGADGREIPVSQLILSHRAADGTLKYMSTVMRDISERREAQLRLEARDALLRRLSERVPGVIYQYRMYPDGRSCFPYASEGIRDIYEVTPEEVRDDATPVFGRLHPQDADAAAQSILQSFRDLTPWRHEYRVVLPQHGVRWVRGEALPDRLDDGSVIWHGYIADVTDVRRAQEELQRAYGENRAVTQAVHDNLFMLNPAGELVWWNRRVEETTGLTAAQLHGKPGISFFHEDDRATVAQAMARATATGYAEIEARFQTVDGPRDYLYNWVRVLDEAGRLLGIAGSGHDISERKRAEQRIRVLASVVEASTEFIAISDLAGRLTYVNHAGCELLGLKPVAVTTKTVSDFVLPEDVALLEREILPAILTSGAWNGDFRLRHFVSGEAIAVSQYAFTIRDERSGQPLALANISHDVRERQQAEDEIRRLNTTLEQRVRERTAEFEATLRELEAFSYSVSHDLRAPLRAIDGFSRILLEDHAAQLDAKGHEYLGRVRLATQRMGVLIDDLLELSRVGRAEMRLTDIDLTRLANEVVEQLRAAEPARTVEVSIAAGLVGRGDERLLRLVLENLLGNAWKYTRRVPDARIEFNATHHDGETLYSVRDNGAGFDMAYAGKLFRPFQRLHRAEDYEGTGVGLAIVARIVNRHGGRVWAEGEPGKGATFYFLLGASR